MKKSEDFIFMEKCFGNIKARENIDDNIKKIERILKRTFDLDISVSISDNNTNTFFGMNIYPSESTMDNMIRLILDDSAKTDVISKQWSECKEWSIEIDSILLYDTKLNANPSEIVAVMLHEIGHIIYSNSIPVRVTRVLRMEYIKLSYQLKQLARDSKIRPIFNLALLDACGSSKTFNLNKELDADKFAIRYGYGDDLTNFISKLIQTDGNRLINRDNADFDKDVKSIVNWSITNIKELEYRKTALKSALKVEMIKSPSNIVKRVAQNIYTIIFGDPKDRYRELLSEQYSGVFNDKYTEAINDEILTKHIRYVVNEAFMSLFDKLGKIKKVSQTDIDILQVEADRIQTNDDKIYLLDRLYGQLNLVNGALDLIELGKVNKVSQSKSTLITMRDQLNRLREQILSTKIVDKEYGVFIRYPKGYQG